MPTSPRPIYYGGQAVIEGVMIRGPREMAVAVRAPDGEIVVRSEELSGIYAGRVCTVNSDGSPRCWNLGATVQT